MLWMLILTTLTAHAGKLADDNGFRGRSFGADPMESAPLEGCSKGSEPGIPWVCPTTIGQVKVTVHYAVGEGIFHTVLLETKGYSECHALKDVFVAAWGEPIQDNPYIEKYVWRDHPVIGTFEYNQFSETCTSLVMNLDRYKEVRAAQEKKASAAVQDL
jgi:hypothetical protein